MVLVVYLMSFFNYNFHLPTLFFIFQIFIEKCLNSTVSIDFVIGTNNNPLRNRKEGLYDKKEKGEKILKK